MRTDQLSPTEDGQTLIVFSLMLTVLLGIMAFVLDVGVLFVERREAQNAADAAALAAAYEMPAGPAAIEEAARQWAQANGYGDGASVSVNTPYNGDPNKVEVIIETDVEALFSRVLGHESFGVIGRAVATVSSTEEISYSMIVLSPDDCSAFYKNGSGALTVSGGIAVNSSCDSAMDISGSGGVVSDGAYYFEDGGWTSSGPVNITPEPEPMSAAAGDPYSGVPEPKLDEVGQSPDSLGSAAKPQLTSISSNVTLRPGVFYGGLKINANTIVTLEPGIYVMAGGGFDLAGTASMTGNGVMFYNTGYGTSSCAGVTLNGGAHGAFAPPADGPYAGILFWQDDDCDEEFLHAGGNTFGTGIYYVPGALMTITGTSDMGATGIIADRVHIQGTGNVTVGGVVSTVVPERSIRLIE